MVACKPWLAAKPFYHATHPAEMPPPPLGSRPAPVAALLEEWVVSNDVRWWPFMPFTPFKPPLPLLLPP